MKAIFFLYLVNIFSISNYYYANNNIQINSEYFEIKNRSFNELTNYDDWIIFGLISFDVQKNGVVNSIKWKTIKEENSDFFTIERTVDGFNYEIITTIKGAGNSTNENNYSIIDKGFKIGINYYRLKLTDSNGQFYYSDLISIDNRIPAEKEITNKVNLTGSEVNEDYRGLVIVNYSDGTSRKIIQ